MSVNQDAVCNQHQSKSMIFKNMHPTTCPPYPSLNPTLVFMNAISSRHPVQLITRFTLHSSKESMLQDRQGVVSSDLLVSPPFCQQRQNSGAGLNLACRIQ